MAMMVDGKDVVECKDVVDCKMWSIELMVGGKDMVDGKDKVQRIWSKMVVGCNLARGND